MKLEAEIKIITSFLKQIIFHFVKISSAKISPNAFFESYFNFLYWKEEICLINAQNKWNKSWKWWEWSKYAQK